MTTVQSSYYKQQVPVVLSNTHPTEFVYLQELLKRLQDRHVEYAQTVAKKMLLMPFQLMM
jgi:hypothetical protein